MMFSTNKKTAIVYLSDFKKYVFISVPKNNKQTLFHLVISKNRIDATFKELFKHFKNNGKKMYTISDITDLCDN